MRQDNHNVRITGPVEIAGKNGQSLNAIPWVAQEITESDTVVYQMGILYVGTGGNVKVKPAGQNNWVTFKNIPNGSFLPIYITAVHTDTTAGDLLMCY